MNSIILDITNAFANSQTSVLQKAESISPRHSHEWKIICRKSQLAAIHPEMLSLCHVVLDNIQPHEVAAEVWRMIDPIIKQKGVATVVSFHHAVLLLQKHVSGSNSVRFFLWKEFKETNGGSRPAISIIEKLKEYIGEEDVISTAVKALQKARAVDRTSAIKFTDLRRHLADENHKFNKNTDPRANLQGLVSAVVTLLRERGLACVEAGPDSAQSLVWLNSPTGIESINRTSEAGATPPESILKSTSAALNTEFKSISRSDQFVNILRELKFGPYSRVRRLVYSKIEELISEGRQLNPTSLIREGIARAGDATTQHQQKEINNHNFPWRGVKEFIIRMFTIENVLIKDGGCITHPKWSNINDTVVDIVEGWKSILDGRLVLELVRSGINLAPHDIPHLAGALYNSQSLNDEKQAESLIADLIKNRQLIENDEGLLCPSIKSDAKTFNLPAHSVYLNSHNTLDASNCSDGLQCLSPAVIGN